MDVDGDREAMLKQLHLFVRSEGSPVESLQPADVIHAHGAIHLEWSELSKTGTPLDSTPQSPYAQYARHDLLDGLAFSVHVLLLERCPAVPDPKHHALRLKQRRLRVRA